jgi:hypothetical protein
MISPAKIQRDCSAIYLDIIWPKRRPPKRRGRGTSHGRFLADLTREIEADRTALVEMAGRLSSTGNRADDRR